MQTTINKSIPKLLIAYFKRINMGLIQSPKLIGFGIYDKSTFETASQYAEVAIIGCAFIKMLKKDGIDGIDPFIRPVCSNYW